MNKLKSRYLSFLLTISTQPKEIIINEFNNLELLYNGHERYYHNLCHIANCLEELDWAVWQFNMIHKSEIEMAIWYHDAVYDTHAANNEDKSAEMAAKSCETFGLDANFCSSIKKLILATKHMNESKVESIDTLVMMDIDLTILGAVPSVYDLYRENIRKEYSWIEKEQFLKGRSQVLKTFLKRQHLYSTDLFRMKFEMQARQNLNRELDEIRVLLDNEQGNSSGIVN